MSVLTRASPHTQRCNLLDSLPFPRGRSDFPGLNLDIMEEFAKFMNKRTPRLLEEFARSRLRQPKNVDLNEVKHVIDQVENLEHLWPLDDTKSREESNATKMGQQNVEV